MKHYFNIINAKGILKKGVAIADTAMLADRQTPKQPFSAALKHLAH